MNNCHFPSSFLKQAGRVHHLFGWLRGCKKCTVIGGSILYFRLMKMVNVSMRNVHGVERVIRKFKLILRMLGMASGHSNLAILISSCDN